MPNAIIYPNAVMIHSQNTSSADTTVMCSGRLIVSTLLAVSQIATLSLDLVDRVFGIFDVGSVGGGDTTWIREDGNGVGEDAHESDGRENNGVEDSRG